MDPRIRWADILMRVEVPNRTEDSDKKLQNSTNNLINRQEHGRYHMLSWHSTGANGMRNNRVRNDVLRMVATAQPPIPPNSTRGITPGLINPLLGNVPGNVVAQPPMRHGPARLRVPVLPQITQAAANPLQQNQTQGTQVQNNHRRDNHGPGDETRPKRNRTSPGPQGRPSKRQAQDPTDNAMNENMDVRSDGTKSSEVNRRFKVSLDLTDMTKDLPLSVVKARAEVTQTQKSKKAKQPTTAVKEENHGVFKKKPKARVAAIAKETRNLTGRRQQHSNLEFEGEHDEDGNEEGDSSAGEVYLEGDPGFEAAYQASRRRRPGRQAQDTAQGSRYPTGPPRQAFSGTPPAGRNRRHHNLDAETIPPTQRIPRGDVSDSELLGDVEGRTLVGPAQLSDTATAPTQSGHPANTSAPARRQNISAITGLPFAGSNRRRGAFSGYGDEDNHRRARISSAASARLPVAAENRHPQSRYTTSLDGSHVTHPEPSSNSRAGFDPNQRVYGRVQTNAPAPNSGANTQMVSPSSSTGRADYVTDTDTTRQTTQTRANVPSGQSDLVPRVPPPQLRRELARHDQAVTEEIRRRESWDSEEISRHTRAILDMMSGDGPDYATGFLEREMERERRRRQPSSDDD